MLVYLDTMICIYAVEGAPPFLAKARTRIAASRAAGDELAISDLTWLECRVLPIRNADAAALADMEMFLNATDIKRVPMPLNVYERACKIRAVHNFKLADALHLAAAVEASCATFLTNDLRLSGFPDIPIEVLR